MKTALIAGLFVLAPSFAQSPDDAIAQRYVRLAQDGAISVNSPRFYGANQAIVKNAPYSADALTQTTQTLADGNRIVRSTAQKLYRDSDGRERREESIMAWNALAQPDTTRLVTISDPVDNVSYVLNPQDKTARKSAGSGLGMVGQISLLNLELQPFQYGVTVLGPNAVRPQNEGAPVKQDLGSKNVEGVIAQGTRTTRTIPAGQIGNQLPIDIVDDVWFSPELQLNVMTSHSDPRSGETVYKLTNIVRANPARSLFEPPPEYSVISTGAGRGRGARGGAPVK